MTSSKRSKPSTRKNKKLPAIIVGGLAGCGKSTVAKMLAVRFKLPRLSAGDVFRAIAREHNTELIEFGHYAEKHPALDRELDSRLLKSAAKGNVILDGRALAYLSVKRHIPALKFFLAVDPRESARRVSKRDHISVPAALRYSARREREIAKRLKKLYGLDTTDVKFYDVVIQTDDFTPKEIVDIIAQFVRYGRN